MKNENLLLATEIAIIDIIDEYGPSTIETISQQTYSSKEELTLFLNNLLSKKLIVSCEINGSVYYNIL